MQLQLNVSLSLFAFDYYARFFFLLLFSFQYSPRQLSQIHSQRDHPSQRHNKLAKQPTEKKKTEAVLFFFSLAALNTEEKQQQQQMSQTTKKQRSSSESTEALLDTQKHTNVSR